MHVLHTYIIYDYLVKGLILLHLTSSLFGRDLAGFQNVLEFPIS